MAKATSAILLAGGCLSTSPLEPTFIVRDANGNRVRTVGWSLGLTLINRLGLTCKTNAGGIGRDKYVLEAN